MRMKLAAAALDGLCAVALPVVVAAQTTAPSDAQVAPGKWHVERVRCSDLLRAADDDRDAAVMFYYGYLAARANFRVIDVSKIEGNIAKVMRVCAATPTITVPEAFRRALGVHTHVKNS